MNNIPLPQFKCNGNGKDHCCYQDGRPCKFLLKDAVPNRRWSCGLLLKYGNWEEVHNSQEYVENVLPIWQKHGVLNCGEWFPVKGQCCLGE